MSNHTLDNLFEILINTVFGFELVAAIIVTVYFRKFTGTRLRHFYIYLWVIVLTEVIGIYFFQNGPRNSLLYSISKVVRINYLLFLFWSYLGPTIIRRIGIGLIIIFNSIFLVDSSFAQTLLISQPHKAFTIGSFLLSFMISLFIYEAVRTELVLAMKQYYIVWIAAGLLIYYAVTIPISAIANAIPEISPGNNNILFIKVGANILMYGIFIIGCIWSKKKYDF